MSMSPKTVLNFTNNNPLMDICNIIRQKISEQSDELFDEIEEDIKNACVLYINKWQPFNVENMLNDKIDKSEFITDTRLIYSTIYLQYGNEKMLKELDEMIEKEPDMKSEADEYLQFIECLKSVQDIQEKDLNSTNPELLQKMNNVNAYLKKKNDELIDMKNTMKELNNSLDKLSVTLNNYVECNNTLDRIECIEKMNEKINGMKDKND